MKPWFRVVTLSLATSLWMGFASRSDNANAGVLCYGYNGHGVEVDNIWCNTIRSYNNSGLTLCATVQSNIAPMNLRFYVYPGPVGPGGGIGHSDFQPLYPFVFGRVFVWSDNTRPAPQCVLDWPPGSTRLRHHKR